MNEKSNIVLIGMPGVGKSTLGVVIAKIFGYDFIDGDLLIQSQEGATLQRIIENKGVEGFLNIENDVLAGISGQRCVIATGGSAVYSAAAMKHLGENGIVVYLQMPFEEVAARLGDLSERGVIMKAGVGNSLSKLYDERLPLYERYAELTVNVSGLDIREAALKVSAAIAAYRV